MSDWGYNRHPEFSFAAGQSHFQFDLKGRVDKRLYAALFDTLENSRKTICGMDPQTYLKATGIELNLTNEYVITPEHSCC